MRIAYLCSEYPAPSHTFIRREVDAMRARGVDVHTFSVRKTSLGGSVSEPEREAIEDTFSLLAAGPLRYAASHFRMFARRPVGYVQAFRLALRHRVPGIQALARSVIYFAEAIVLADELERRDVQLLHNHFANAAATTGLIASRLLDLKWGMTLHGTAETDYPSGLLLADKIIAADYVACVSYFGRAQAMRGLPHRYWDKLFINRCGIDLTALPATPPAAGRTRPRLICVGRLSEEKGHFGLLHALAAARQAGADADLVLVGDGPLRSEIAALAKTLGLSDRVTFLGALPEQQTLAEIARSDVLVLSSMMEGLPVVLMEAMGLSLPVVAPRVAGIPELVTEGESGLLFTPGNWDELAAALQRILADQSLRARFAVTGREKVEKEFEINVATEPLYQAFKRTI